MATLICWASPLQRSPITGEAPELMGAQAERLAVEGDRSERSALGADGEEGRVGGSGPSRVGVTSITVFWLAGRGWRIPNSGSTTSSLQGLALAARQRVPLPPGEETAL